MAEVCPCGSVTKHLQRIFSFVVIAPISERLLLTLQILNSYVQFEVSHGPSDVASMQLSRSRVTDGEWHHLLIELRSAKEGKDIKYLVVMTLDYGVDQVSGHWGDSSCAGTCR